MPISMQKQNKKCQITNKKLRRDLESRYIFCNFAMQKKFFCYL